MIRETILVVEDSKLNRQLLETVLKPHGYHLLIAKTGRQAIEIATRERPDLILMDMKLPKINGYDAVKVLKSRPETAKIPIVALTAHAIGGGRQRAMAAGCEGYIAKPIDTRAFPRQVRQFIDAAR